MQSVVSRAKEEYDALVTSNLGLVRAFARRFEGRGVEYDDLYGAGCVGLCKAAKNFDESLGFAFSTYAVPIIVGEMKRLFRDDGTVKVSRRIKEIYRLVCRDRDGFCTLYGREPRLSETAARLGLDVSEVSLALTAASPPLSLSMPETDDADGGDTLDLPVPSGENEIIMRIDLARAMKTLAQRDREIVRLRYYVGLTQQKTAEALSMTQVQVSRAEKRILAFLREKLM